LVVVLKELVNNVKLKYITGFEISADVSEKIHQFKKSNKHLKAVKWTKTDNLHLTALYLGKTSPQLLTKNVELLKAICAQSELLELDFTSIAYSPGENPRMIWGYFKPNQQFDALIVNLAKSFRIPIRKSIVPHVTIAHLKKDAKFYKPIFNPIDRISMKIKMLNLWESSLSIKSAKYLLLEQLVLRAKK